MSIPVCSIITVCLNNETGLEKTIQSVISQTFHNVEHIIIDGGSVDGTLTILAKYNDRLAYSCSEKDGGIYDAMNKGILHAKGTYLLFLNSGDTLVDENVLENIFKMPQTAELVYGNLIFDLESGPKLFEQPAVLDLPYLLTASSQHPSTFIKKELFEKYGQYDTNFKMAADYDFFLRVLVKFNASSYYTNKTVAMFDTSGLSSLEKYKSLEKSERERAQLKNIPGVVLEYYHKTHPWISRFPVSILKNPQKSSYFILLTRVYLKILNWIC